MSNNPFHKYMDVLNELDSKIDFSRMRAFHLKGHTEASGNEDIQQTNKQMRSAILLEIKQLETELLNAITALEKLKDSAPLDYKFIKDAKNTSH